MSPPANTAPPFRSSLRLVRFEPISLSFEKCHYDVIAFPWTKVYAALPNLASAEQGLADFEAPTWFAVFLPRGASEPITRKLNP